MKKKSKVLLIGWDAADWKVINPLLDAGKMPALESLVNNGVIGNIATLDPALSPMLWTSIATGKHAYKHGITGFIQGAENDTKVQPVSSASRKVKAVWNMLNEHKLKTNIVGWWPSHPAEHVDGAMVSNFYGKVGKDETWDNWKGIDKSIYPETLNDVLNKARVHPGEFSIEQILPFIPNIKDVPKEKHKLVNILLKDLAECVSIHSASTWLLENTDWDFTGIYYNAIDHISHVFMRYHPPKLEWIDEEDYKIFKDVINGMYVFHDMMLARLLEFTDEDTYVVLLSDHGFHSDHLRMKVLPKEPAAIANEHNPYGIVCIKGPGIKKDERIYGASLLDITPTILQLFDLPIGKDMDGKILAQVFNEVPKVKTIDSWETNNKTSSHFNDIIINSQETIERLVDLGYLDEEALDKSPENVKRILDENKFYLARSYYQGKQYSEAIEILKYLTSTYPKQIRYWHKLAHCYIEKKNTSELKNVIEKLETSFEKTPPSIYLLKAKHAYLETNYTASLSHLKAAEKLVGDKPQLNLQLGLTYLKTHAWNNAIIAFQKILKLNNQNSVALHGIGVAYIGLKKYEEAIDWLFKINRVDLFQSFSTLSFGRSIISFRII